MRATQTYAEVGVFKAPVSGVIVTQEYLEVAVNPTESSPPNITAQATPEARRPLTMVDGQITQLSSSDTLDASVSEVDVSSATNNSGSTMVVGNAVYIDGFGSIDFAIANSAPTKRVFGLVRDESIITATSGRVQSGGRFEATTDEWDTVTGMTGGLTAGACYFLSPTSAGGLTDVPPSSIGQFVVPVGIAESPTVMQIIHELSVAL